ncbi:uncharacterized protein LOC127812677 [Diospyros lotus]|uniref:uncharacterized protein LOC127812677 n=1 Tax=Diospyros lotus TaxID=55363 RepID=UPI00225182E8|nr:uncharacterized protein LOC127812677 [Diospyros lotus]
MGNNVSHRLSSATTGKVILSDGSVHEYDKPLIAAELMLEHPQQVVVEFDSAVNRAGKRLAPLPADMKLEMGRVYLMVPRKRGKPVALSPEEARRLLLMSSSVLNAGSFLSATTGVVPFFARICGAGTREGHRIVLPREEKMKEREEEGSKLESLPELMEGRPEYLSRQLSGKGWKPSLDTIKEKDVKTKVSPWLFFNVTRP